MINFCAFSQECTILSEETDAALNFYNPYTFEAQSMWQKDSLYKVADGVY